MWRKICYDMSCHLASLHLRGGMIMICYIPKLWDLTNGNKKGGMIPSFVG
jgi:hypothetical protein